MALQIEGHDADHGPAFIVQGQVARRPAFRRDGAAGRLAGVKEVVGYEGIA
uniref:ABC transporter ATP-binding protein n=1 Tax=Parastrongyloides trichosuri TaxID=131310 RepID=A0A0N5A784_PARTI